MLRILAYASRLVWENQGKPTMAESFRCAQCGAVVPGDAPMGLCPNCVLAAGFPSDGGSLAGVASGGDTTMDARFVPPQPEELAPHFPDLEIIELLGRGGMGVVYKARQKRLDRLVALKILAPKIAQDPAFAERFAREARALAMLNHANIVAVHDFGQTSFPFKQSPATTPKKDHAAGTDSQEQDVDAAGRPSDDAGTSYDGGGECPLYYFVMEYVDGVNLRRLMETGKIAPEQALSIVPQICTALQFAHDAGVVHRDIKPENIM
ncbi:MAG: serine/threonine protein kinase, partial [Pirellulales bacterium]|nr:serine/threonine protein kinase [Pirellulales bacterium]